ncbi:hypothetical protein DFH07DRAFT_783429 [Mycena maculata]|uniref:Uncharacterized protein n=1 Tax=Mycena maculata TaxID=230809 RepID=A0AAD7HNQ3_9AGAR|nr:hypothetical protein DFH07DRAFT_783429 [Mycena maculata]
MAEIPELKNDVATTGDGPVRHKVHWYRNTIFQIFVVGGGSDVLGSVGINGLGTYNALSSLGAGGLATPWYVYSWGQSNTAYLIAHSDPEGEKEPKNIPPKFFPRAVVFLNILTRLNGIIVDTASLRSTGGAP